MAGMVVCSVLCDIKMSSFTLAVAIILLFEGKVYFARHLQMCSYSSRAVTVQGRCLIKEIR